MIFRVFTAGGYVLVILQAFGNPSFLCILGSRLLVNLKEAAELGVNGGTNYRMSSASISELSFVLRCHDEGTYAGCIRTARI